MSNEMLASMEAKIKEMKELQNEIDTLTALVESLKDEIKEAMGDDTTLVAGPFKVSYKTVVSNRFDSKAFKADYPTIYEAYTKPSVTRPFKVS